MSNFNIFSTIKLILDLKLSLDKAHQDLILCFPGVTPYWLTPKTLEPIFRNVQEIFRFLMAFSYTFLSISSILPSEDPLSAFPDSQNQLYDI